MYDPILEAVPSVTLSNFAESVDVSAAVPNVNVTKTAKSSVVPFDPWQSEMGKTVSKLRGALFVLLRS